MRRCFFIFTSLILLILFVALSCEKNKSILITDISGSIPNSPYPGDNSSQIPLDVMVSWKCENAPTYTVYFDTINPPLNVLAEEINVNYYEVKDLLYNTNYYWRVEAALEAGDSTLGDVWHFKTEDISLDSTSKISFYFPNIEAIVEDYWIEHYGGIDTTSGIDTFETSIENHLILDVKDIYNLVYLVDTIHYVVDTTIYNAHILEEGWIVFNFSQLKFDMFYHYNYLFEFIGEPGFLKRDLTFTLKNVSFSIIGRDSIQSILLFNDFENSLESIYYTEGHKSYSCINAYTQENYIRLLEVLNFEYNGEMKLEINF